MNPLFLVIALIGAQEKRYEFKTPRAACNFAEDAQSLAKRMGVSFSFQVLNPGGQALSCAQVLDRGQDDDLDKMIEAEYRKRR